MIPTIVADGAVICASAFVGTLGFAILLQAPRRAWFPASAIGAAAYTLFWVLEQLGMSLTMATFIGALLGSTLAQICARRMRMIATIFITLSIVAQVPGLDLYRCMAYLAQGQTAAGVDAGVSAMSVILMIALGLGVGGFLCRLLWQRRPGDTGRQTVS